MKARRIDSGVIWDLPIEYYNQYKEDFILLEDLPAEQTVEVKVEESEEEFLDGCVIVEPEVKRSAGRPRKNK